jgi:hypothetical protein
VSYTRLRFAAEHIEEFDINDVKVEGVLPDHRRRLLRREA